MECVLHSPCLTQAQIEKSRTLHEDTTCSGCGPVLPWCSRGLPVGPRSRGGLGWGLQCGESSGLGVWEMGSLGPEQKQWVEIRSLSLGAESMSICKMLYPGVLPGLATAFNYSEPSQRMGAGTLFANDHTCTPPKLPQPF